MPNWSSTYFAIILVTLTTTRGALAGDVESFWIAPGGGSFQDESNWSGPVPAEGVTAIFEAGVATDYTVTFEAIAASDRLAINNGRVEFLLDGNTYGLSDNLPMPPSLSVSGPPGFDTVLSLNGGMLQSTFSFLAVSEDSEGDIEVAGAGTVFETLSHLIVGDVGFSRLDISNGALVSASNAIFGEGSDSSGIATIVGGQTRLDVTGTWTIGERGFGRADILAGGQVFCGNAIMGQQIFSDSRVDVVGQGSAWIVDGFLDVGQSGDGDVTISLGGTIDVGGFATIGTFPSVFEDRVRVEGEGSTFHVGDRLDVGFLSAGRLTVLSGGLVTSHEGGVAAATSTEETTGRAVVRHDQSRWEIATLLEVGGLLELIDGGLVDAGDMIVLAEGSVRLDDGRVEAMTLTIDTDGRVIGNGVTTSSVYSEGIISPGFEVESGEEPVGLLEIDGGVTLTESSVLQMDLAGFSGQQNDRVEIDGPVTLGGRLAVVPNDELENEVGASAIILTASSVTGEFDAFDPPDIGFYNRMGVVYNETSVELRLFTGSDFNQDGVINIEDLLEVLLNWGPCPDPPAACPGDTNDSGDVNILDLLRILVDWSE